MFRLSKKAYIQDWQKLLNSKPGNAKEALARAQRLRYLASRILGNGADASLKTD